MHNWLMESNITLTRDGWKNGKPLHALQNEAGQTKFVITCKFCKKSHHVWLASRVHPTYKCLVPDHKELEAAYQTHIAECDKAQAWIARYLNTWKSTNECAVRVAMAYMGNTVFHWMKRDDGGHECNARCMGATGHLCECRCQGKNHGGRG